MAGDEALERVHGLLRILWPMRAVLVAVALVIFVVLHGRILYLTLEHVTVSRDVVFGVIALVVLKHLGVLGCTYAIRRRAWNRP